MNSVIEAQLTLQEQIDKELRKCFEDIDYFIDNYYHILTEVQQKEVLVLKGVIETNEKIIDYIKKPKLNKRFLKK